MWLMLQQEKPKDYVISTGTSKSVEELVDYVFGKLGLSKSKHLKTDKKYERPEELYFLKGDSTLARREISWKPTYNFETILDEMIDCWKGKYN